MRKKGMGYKAIARETKLSRDSVRNYCRWHHLNGYGAAVAAAFGKETVQILKIQAGAGGCQSLQPFRP